MANTKKAIAKDMRKRVAAKQDEDTDDTFIGELGRKGEAREFRFGWFGHTIRVNPGAGELELVDFMRKANKLDIGEDMDNMKDTVEAMEVTIEFLQHQIHPDDWPVFWDLAKTNRQNTKDLLDVAMIIVEKITDFPTSQPSSSSAGRQATGTRSSGDSRSLTTKALDLLPKRPDLQMAHVRAQEALVD